MTVEYKGQTIVINDDLSETAKARWLKDMKELIDQDERSRKHKQSKCPSSGREVRLDELGEDGKYYCPSCGRRIGVVKHPHSLAFHYVARHNK